MLAYSIDKTFLKLYTMNVIITIIYLSDPTTGEYDSKAITKLLSNFRSHPALLHLPSRLFYENELVAKGDPLVTTSLESWDKLPNPKGKFPIIFHGIIGEDKREARSPSFFNAEEAVIVVDYIQELLTAKTGIAKKVSILHLPDLGVKIYIILS